MGFSPHSPSGSTCLGLNTLCCQPLSSLLPSGPRCSLCRLGTGPGDLQPGDRDAGLLLTTPHSSCRGLVPQPREPPSLAGVTLDAGLLSGPCICPLEGLSEEKRGSPRGLVSATKEALNSAGDSSVGAPSWHHVGTKFRKLPVFLAVTTTITSDPHQGSGGAGPPLGRAGQQFIRTKEPPSPMW